MRRTPEYLLEDDEEIARLVRENPWATFVSVGPQGLVASHYPVLLDEEATQLTILSHFGRPDEVAHDLGRRELLVIVAGPHGYVSPSWYPPGAVIPTWNHVTAHLYGTPEILSEEENLAVLRRLVDVMERPVPEPRALDDDEDHTRRVARGTVGLRMVVDRVDARRKLSQDKPEAVRASVVAHLQAPGPYSSPALAREMEREQAR